MLVQKSFLVAIDPKHDSDSAFCRFVSPFGYNYFYHPFCRRLSPALFLVLQISLAVGLVFQPFVCCPILTGRASTNQPALLGTCEWCRFGPSFPWHQFETS